MLWRFFSFKKRKDLVTDIFPQIYLLFNIVAAKASMSEDLKTKLLLELITKEVVMPTKHPEPIRSISIFLRFKSHKFFRHSATYLTAC